MSNLLDRNLENSQESIDSGRYFYKERSTSTAESSSAAERCVGAAERGARMVLSARRLDTLVELADSLPRGRSRHWVVPLDLADSDKG